MKKIFAFIAFFFIFLSYAIGQTSLVNPAPVQDTAHYPYWIEMMQDQSVNFFAVQRAFYTYWKDRPITKGCGYKPFKRWEYMMQSRVRPDGTRVPEDQVYNAYEKYISRQKSVGGNWVSLGPASLPTLKGYKGMGRVNAIGFHPSNALKIYIGAPAGGLWESSDGGLTWVSNTDGLPTLGVSCITLDYTNPSVIYIGTGDRDAGDASGLGVFKSTDGGLTWSPSNTGMGSKTVGKMIIHPSNHVVLLAATSSGIYKSTDGGANWALKQAGNFKDLVFKPGDPSIVYATASGVFCRSSNTGESWTAISNGIPTGQRAAIAVTAANSNYVYVVLSNANNEFKGLYRSTDSGNTFTTRSTSPNILDWSCDGSGTGGQAWYDLDIAADPANANTLFVGGVDVWKSVDGGQSWAINSHWYGGCNVPAVHADLHVLEYSPVSGRLYAGDDGGVYYTANGGTDWVDISSNLVIGQIYKLGQSRTVKEKVINGFQDNGTSTYTASGWLDTGGGDGMECLVDHTDPAYTYHTVYYGSIYRKYNNSNEVQIAGLNVFGITEEGDWVTPFIMDETDPNTMFVGYKNIWRSNNIRSVSINWTKLSDNLGGSNTQNLAVLEQSPADKSILYAARHDGRLFRSDNVNDAAPTWVDLTSYLPSAGTPTSLEAHPSNADVVYMTLNQRVYKSVNKGLTWTDLTGTLPDTPINSIVYYKNSDEGLYIGTDVGVFYRDQYTGDWLPFSSGLPASARITEVEIYYDNSNPVQDAIRACTYGRGLWSSDMYHALPVASFEGDQTIIGPGSQVNFTDLSSGVPTSWLWTFEGGTPSTSTLKNPSGIVYNNPGTFDVTLTVTNPEGSDTKTIPDYITVNGSILPSVGFKASPTVPCFGTPVEFTDTTLYGPVSWQWQFSPNTVTFLNGTSSTSQNPFVQFMEAKPYSVTLSASNTNGSNSLTRNNYIYSGGYLVPFSEDFESGFDTRFWTIENPDNSITWDTVHIGGTTPGNIAARINFFNYYMVNKRDELISPPLNLTSSLEGSVLKFFHAYAQHVPIKDSLIIYLSQDCGSTWQRIFAMGPDGTPGVFVTHPPMDESFVPAQEGDWCGGSYGTDCYEITLPSYPNSARLKFESFNRGGNNLYLDNILVDYATAVPAEPKYHDIQIFPNPSTGEITVSVSPAMANCKVTIFNTLGIQILNDIFPAGNSVLSKKYTLDKGVYFLKAESDALNVVKKIIVQ